MGILGCTRIRRDENLADELAADFTNFVVLRSVYGAAVHCIFLSLSLSLRFGLVRLFSASLRVLSFSILFLSLVVNLLGYPKY